MRWVLCCLFTILASPLWASESECRANDIRRVATADRLVISDAAITFYRSGCPKIDERLGLEITVPEGRPLYIFLRIEGTEEYISNVGRKERFRAWISRKNGLAESRNPLRIDNPYINKNAAKGEARENSGFFDWRFYGVIKAFLVPGEYRLQLTHSGRNVCLKGDSCHLTFRVVE